MGTVTAACSRGLLFFLSSFCLGHIICPCFGVLGQRMAVVEVILEDSGDEETETNAKRESYRLQGTLFESQGDNGGKQNNKNERKDSQKSSEEIAEGSLKLLNDDIPMKTEDDEAWIGVLPVEKEQGERMKSDSQESFTSAIVNKMKRALVLGASALLILALNQNTVHEMDVSQVLTRPIIVIQTSENVTKLISVLLRGLRASARITRKALAQDNLGVTLTLWSTCGLSRGGLYGEWQGVICTGENSSQVQKYLQKLWNTILLVALSLCTGVIVQAHWQFMRNQSNNEDAEFTLKQDLLKQLSSLKTKKYHPHKKQRVHQSETENCAVCLDQFHRNQVTCVVIAEGGCINIR
ncbi:RING finger protein 215 isoform X3 [Protopterus annectens]|uniref:RING finger protein 215 isoform X3 n=1 Tax=Protopterus annectens TaxID=7888 RepID=UPI001CFBBE6A|nr:RING finger protein 215 isoform X3 [Protopterus annectens]